MKKWLLNLFKKKPEIEGQCPYIPDYICYPGPRCDDCCEALRDH